MLEFSSGSGNFYQLSDYQLLRVHAVLFHLINREAATNRGDMDIYFSEGWNQFKFAFYLTENIASQLQKI
jgi:hypothetical protein